MASSFGNYNIPPDTQGAVGPNHVMTMANGIVQIHSRTGVLASSVSLNSFATVTVSGTTYPRNGAFDPRLIYDRLSGKWFATIMEFGSPARSNNGVILAVSRTSDPTGTWDKYFVNFGVASALTDYSTLGVDANGVYLAATIFPASGSSVSMAATPKASLIFDALTNPSPSLGTVSMVTGIAGYFGTPHPAHNIDNSTAASCAWFVGASNFTAGGLAYRKVSWSGSTPTIDAANSTLFIGGNVDFPVKFIPSGSTRQVDTGDFRLMSAFIRGNSLYCSRSVGCDSSGNTTFGSGLIEDRTACEWFQVGVSTTTATATQTGRVFDASGSPRSYFYPTMAVTGQGHIAMTFSGGNSSEFLGVYTCGRLLTDTAGTMQSILQAKAGVDVYTVTFKANNGTGTSRWGDYSFTQVDPNDDQSIWGIQEFAATRGTKTLGSNSFDVTRTNNNVGLDGNWQFWIQKLLAPAPTAVATAVTAIPGQTNVTLSVTGTGLFDPGAGFTNRLTATSGAGISNVRVAYINPTKAAVTFDVSSAAAVGTRDITLTNPDGQAVTLNNVINIVAAQPVLKFSRTITNTGSAWRVTLTIQNKGGVAATSVRVLTSRLGATATATATPISVGTIAAGSSTSVQIDFPLAAASSGVAVVHRITGDYTGNTFSSAALVTP